MSFPFEKDLQNFYVSAAPDLSIYLSVAVAVAVDVGRNPIQLSDQIPFHGPSSFCEEYIAPSENNQTGMVEHS